MYVPLNPDKVTGIWDKFANSLLLNSFVYLINDNGENGVNKPKKLSHDEVDEVVSLMRESDYTRIGSSKMIPTPTHFSIRLYKNDEGRLVELIVVDNAEDTIRSAINLVIQFSFFELKDLKKLIIPLSVKGIDDSEVNVVVTEGGNEMIITRKPV